MLNNQIFIIISTVFVSNIVLNKILGLCSFIGFSKELEISISRSSAKALILKIGSMTGWTTNHYLLKSNNLIYLKILIIIDVITNVVELVATLMEKNINFLYKILGVVQSGR